jgi:energy-coupling factor transport system permease protein
MALDVTIGQYYGTGSVIHKLDPRAKLLFVLMFIISIFVAKDVYAFAFLALVVIISVLISRVPVRLVFKGLKPLVIIILFTSVLNIFLTKGENLLFTKEIIKDLWTVNIYKEGLINAALLALRIIILLMGTSIYFSYTTSYTFIH